MLLHAAQGRVELPGRRRPAQAFDRCGWERVAADKLPGRQFEGLGGLAKIAGDGGQLTLRHPGKEKGKPRALFL